MKTVDITVHFTAKVPDDLDAELLCIDVDTSRIKIMSLHDSPPQEVEKAKVLEYETLFTQELVD